MTLKDIFTRHISYQEGLKEHSADEVRQMQAPVHSFIAEWEKTYGVAPREILRNVSFYDSENLIKTMHANGVTHFNFQSERQSTDDNPARFLLTLHPDDMNILVTDDEIYNDGYYMDAEEALAALARWLPRHMYASRFSALAKMFGNVQPAVDRHGEELKALIPRPQSMQIA